MRVWAVSNQKGGVGKTTTVVTLAGLLADMGKSVLLVDLDPHGSLTSYFRYDPDQLGGSVYDLFKSSEQLDSGLASQLLLDTSHQRIKLIGASTAMATLERQAMAQEGMGLVVSKALATLWDDFEYVIIDSPPVLGVLMVNAMAACERLIVPVQTEYLAIKGLERMLKTLLLVNKSRKRPLPFTILPTFYDRRTQASVQSLRLIRNSFPDHVSNAVVPVDTKFRNASSAGIVPSEVDAGSRGVRAYNMLLKSLLSQDETVQAKGTS
ncbi:ParA family protein [Pokkaliibacter sp. CJK22405]|uniref:ParA family protein n=1 Tax=Pokkaliibacter sp. CJK22405 TaxID=3384615 RepID=UPI00398533D6